MRQRESESVRKEMAPTGWPHRAAIGREGQRTFTSWRRQAGPACQGPRARRRRRARGAGPNGPTWVELAFLFFREFLIAFL
jgi:hypothetical protein